MGARFYRVIGIGLAGLFAAVAAPQPASAQDLNRVVRTLDRILNPEDARRYEERARREHRPEEERYWRDYRSGLEAEQRDRGGSWAEDARRYEERARREHRVEEERYWRDYRAGLESHPRDRGDRFERRPGSEEARRDEEGRDYREEARRHEEAARRRHRIEEERYWHDYRLGLDRY